jgi:hypothetical protein
VVIVNGNTAVWSYEVAKILLLFFIDRYVTNRRIENNVFVKEIGYSNIEQCCK